MLGNITEKYHDQFYVILRVVVGLLFFLHGTQKFGFFGGQAPEFGTLFWGAGVIEVIAGPLILLGLFTRLAALVGALEMLVAYFVVHLPNGLVPLQNGGELAVLYFVSFLLILAHGSQKWSLDNAVLKKEYF